MTLDDLEDDTTRPKAPPVPGLTPEQRRRGQKLAAIHRMYRQELSAIQRLMNEIGDGLARPDALETAVAGMRLTENLALFGSVCGQECAILANHHEIEEQYLFPALALNAVPGMRAVIDRLVAEHGLIHSLLVDLHGAAAQLAATPTPVHFDACATAFQRLDRGIRSHFGYEETELAPTLGQSSFPI